LRRRFTPSWVIFADNPRNKVYFPKKDAKAREVYSLEESQALLENLEVEKTENSKKYFL
jgi:hypothetical protein